MLDESGDFGRLASRGWYQNQLIDEILTALHQASDRENLQVVEQLLETLMVALSPLPNARAEKVVARMKVA
jgi:hypothetical protein